jgi:hypothetical protein
VWRSGGAGTGSDRDHARIISSAAYIHVCADVV